MFGSGSSGMSFAALASDTGSGGFAGKKGEVVIVTEKNHYVT